MGFMIDHAMRVAIEAAETAGTILRDMLLTAAVREKAPKDLVTDADIAAQQAIEQRLLGEFPTHRFLGEESNFSPDLWPELSRADYCWVVDPLDGTANFVHRLPNFAVSIALLKDNEIVLGVVFDPMARELYTSKRGEGAFCNGKVIRASSVCSLESAMVAVSFPPQVHRESVEIKQFIEVLIRSQSVRRLGSAALNLCYVAQGRLDGYWANSLKPWDMAAGVLIAKEAGATVSKISGEPFNPWIGEVLTTSTERLQLEIQDCLNTSGR
jgi:myo-inositol-1(or 4)-monophosphatase